MQRDVSAIEAKIRELTTQAEHIVEKYPEDENVTKEELNRLNEKFAKLSDALKLREEKLGQAGNLQTFLRDMAEFQVKIKIIVFMLHFLTIDLFVELLTFLRLKLSKCQKKIRRFSTPTNFHSKIFYQFC